MLLKISATNIKFSNTGRFVCAQIYRNVQNLMLKISRLFVNVWL